ncbi:tyrosine-type recombinase/integrase [Paraburkholderia susongensis]|uniref:Site-specific recombinase XerD n=1 Tax=Paraburkholderia susongensis TaxID=1515439 RepID=A0A1X7M598_9BURK|nr:tyrosine-type recombinase/integrase [Paraburkholderia susongensis]SMG61255.1 Site-specific recombinase XerD [Paraburkholderia susongensis]
MNDFARSLDLRVQDYIELRQSLGYVFRKQAGTLRAFSRYVQHHDDPGPFNRDLALRFVVSEPGGSNFHVRRYGVLRHFAEYLAIFDCRTESLDRRAFPRRRTVAPARILTDAELIALIKATASLSRLGALRAQTMETLVGLLASTRLRSGEALRLDRADVDLNDGVLLVRRTKFRKDRIVPVHTTTLAALRTYGCERDRVFSDQCDESFFVGPRGCRLSTATFHADFRRACCIAGLDDGSAGAPRPHDLRHRFAVTRLAEWHRQNADVQGVLPLLATYLGHVRYSDTAYYVTGTAELLGLASQRAFNGAGGV